MLSGISLEAYNASPHKISRAVGQGPGKSISDIIFNLVTEKIYNQASLTTYGEISDSLSYDISKQISIEDTNGIHKFVIPSLSIGGTLDFLINEASNDDSIPSYFFYEDDKGFNLKSISTMVDEEPLKSYYWLPYNIDLSLTEAGRKIEHDFFRMHQLYVNRQTDIFENVKKGLFKSNVTSIGYLSKISLFL